jgi:hypothetical protein
VLCAGAPGASGAAAGAAAARVTGAMTRKHLAISGKDKRPFFPRREKRSGPPARTHDTGPTRHPTQGSTGQRTTPHAPPPGTADTDGVERDPNTVPSRHNQVAQAPPSQTSRHPRRPAQRPPPPRAPAAHGDQNTKPHQPLTPLARRTTAAASQPPSRARAVHVLSFPRADARSTIHDPRTRARSPPNLSRRMGYDASDHEPAPPN